MTTHLNSQKILDLARQVANTGYAFAPLTALDDNAGSVLTTLAPSWHDLPLDAYLADGGRYRSRRHASFIQNGQSLEKVPYRPHWQPTSYNALHGGLLRTFSEIKAEVLASAELSRLIITLGELFQSASGKTEPWYVEAHQFRIDPSEGVGKPTPEGAHRDGVDYVALLLLAREGIEGGVTTVLQPDKTPLAKHCLMPGELMLLDDVRVIHETTVIKAAAMPSYRDSLVITYRRDGFMDPI